MTDALRPPDLPDELTVWHGGPPNERAERIEWRAGWWWSGHVGLDWREWGFGFHIGYKHRRNFGGDFQLGPFYGYGCFEYGHEAFEDGKRAGFGVGEV
jgi:hypothetical protein